MVKIAPSILSANFSDLKEEINNLTGVEWEMGFSRIGDIKHSVANCIPLQTRGWETKITIKEGLKACFGEK